MSDYELREGEELLNPEDLMAALGSVEKADYSGEVGFKEGQIPAHINKGAITRKSIEWIADGEKQTAQLLVARYWMTSLSPDYPNWEFEFDQNVGINDNTGKLADATFRASLVRVLGDAVVEAQIKSQPTTYAEYLKGIEIMESRDVLVTFRKRRNKKTGEYSESAFPTGVMNPIDGDAATSGSTAGSVSI